MEPQNHQSEEVRVPPYVSFKTLTNFIGRLRDLENIPSRIDTSIMTTLAPSVRRQLVLAMKFLDLVDANNLPTKKLSAVITKDEAKFKQGLTEIILEAYKPILKDLTLNNATSAQLNEVFKPFSQKVTVRNRCKAFLIAAARECAIPISPLLIERAKNRNNDNVPKRPRGRPPKAEFVPEKQKENWHQMFLDKLPDFDPTWTPEVQAKWFEALKELKDLMKS